MLGGGIEFLFSLGSISSISVQCRGRPVTLLFSESTEFWDVTDFSCCVVQLMLFGDPQGL